MIFFLGFMFSAIGMAYFIYGKKSVEFTYLIVGVLLMIYPYIIRNSVTMSVIGLVLTASPHLIKYFYR